MSGALPHVTLTYASSLDSMISLAPGVRTILSGPETKSMTHYLRLRHDAILIGGGTAAIDDPSLNCRYPGAGLDDQPRPIIVDPRCRFSAEDRKLCQVAAEGRGKAPWVFVPRMCESDGVLESVGGAYVVWSDSAADGALEDIAPWRFIMEELKRRGVNSIMVEGGAAVINSLLTLPEIVNATIVTIAPTWLGRGGVQVAPRSRTSDGGTTGNAAWLQQTTWRQFGSDVVLCGKLTATSD